MSDLTGKRSSFPKVQVGIIVLIAGFLFFTLGVDPGIFHLNRSPVFGFVQIAVMLVGLAVLCLGGYICLNSLWNGTQKSIAADIGFRLVSTGYVVALVSGMADVFGLGSHPFPNVPYFGRLQAIGVMVGETIIAIGFLLMIPYKRNE